MTALSLAQLLYVALVFLLAGWVKGMAGLGLPTVAMGLLSFALPAPQAASLLLLPSLLTNIWQAFGGAALGRLASRLGGLWVGVILGSLFSVLPAMSRHAGFAGAALGAVLAAYGLWGLGRPRLLLPARHVAWLGPVAGYATGALSAATGVFVVPAVPYLQSLGLKKDELVQALGLSFLVATLALAAHLARSGQVMAADLGLSAAALLPAFVGLRLGERIRRRVSDAAFRLGFFAALVTLGTSMLVLHLARAA